MNTNAQSLIVAVTFGVVTLGGLTVSRAQVFEVADARTVATVGNNALADRLYLADGVVAPVSTHLWFVADVNADGIGTSATFDTESNVLTLGPDDVVVRRDVVDGGLIGNFPGQFVRNNIAYDASYGGGDFYVVLFNTTTPVANWNTFVGTSDLKWGSGQLTVTPPAGIGNFRWDLVQNVVANVNTVTVVPEISPTGVATALGLAGWGVVRFLRRRSR